MRGKPVGILKATGRTCIIAASVEAKKYGVKTGSSLFEAKKLCPSIILVPADFDKYADITYRFINICKDYSPICEVFSLDECFIDVTDTEKLFADALKIALQIKRRLREEIGDYMTCSVGIAYNRLLAKLASSQIKPDGLFLIAPDNALEVLDKANLMDVCGLGFGLYNHLGQLGIDNFPKLRTCSLIFLKKHFGPYWSVHLHNLARGIDHSEVVPFSEIADAKSVSRTYTTHRTLTSRAEVFKLIRNLCEETAAKARKMSLTGRYVGLAFRDGQKSWYGHRTLKQYLDDGKALFELCLAISQNWPAKSVRFCGVTLGMLTKKEYLPLPLFPLDQKRQVLTATIDRINWRFGEYTLFPARLLGMSIIKPEVNGYFGDKKYRLDYLTPTQLGDK